MPPVKKPAKPNKPNEPKKPSSRSKTKNAECSQAASNWQLSLRGKATLSPETYQTLAKCRALASSQRKADSYGRTGKLSEQGKTALESRLQSRFDSGLITDKSRKAKLADLLAWRKSSHSKIAEHQKSGDHKGLQIAGGIRSAGFDAAKRRDARAQATGMTPEDRAKTALRTASVLASRRSSLEGQKRGMGAQMLVDNASIGVRRANLSIEKLRAQRKARGATKAAQGAGKDSERQRIADGSKRVGDTAPPRTEDAPKPKSSLAEGRTNRALDKTMGFNGTVMTRRKAIEMRVEAGAKIVMSPSGTRRLMNKDDSFYDESQISKTAMDYAAELIGKRQNTPKYSLGGQLAPGRGTAERFLAAKFLKETRSDLATAQKKISELGKEPRKPSTENQFFGSGGRQNASPEVVSAYDSSQRLHSAWRRKYMEAKKKEVTASNILFHAMRRKKESRLTAKTF